MSRQSLAALLVLLLAAPVMAAPPDHAGNPGKGNGQGKGAASFDNKGNGHAGGGHGAPDFDAGNILRLLQDNRSYYSPGASLPPGVAKNLARGKPLPPGIAKRLDSRLLSRLPHYDGYEWMQAGTDLLLVTVATGVIYEVLRNALD